MGVARHADAGYPEALDAARRHALDLPMLELLVLDVNVAIFLLQGFQRTIAAHGKKPLRQMSLDIRLLLRVQPHECFLHNVPGAIQILQDAQGILQQRTLKAIERTLDPRRLFLGFREKHIRRDYPTSWNLLRKNSGIFGRNRKSIQKLHFVSKS